MLYTTGAQQYQINIEATVSIKLFNYSLSRSCGRLDYIFGGNRVGTTACILMDHFQSLPVTDEHLAVVLTTELLAAVTLTKYVRPAKKKTLLPIMREK